MALLWIRMSNSPHHERLLILLVKLANDEHKDWADPGFEESQEKALGKESLPVMAGGCEDKTNTPDQDEACSDSLDGISLSQLRGRIGAANESKEEYGRAHGVPISRQLQIFLNPKKCLLEIRWSKPLAHKA